MTRGVTGSFAAALAGSHVMAFPLVDLEFASAPLYLCGADTSVAYGGRSYTPVLGLGSIEAVRETDVEIAGVALTLSGVPSSSVALALTEPVHGRPIRIRLAAIVRNSNSDSSLIVDDNVWVGRMDTLTLIDGADSATLRLTAEHRLAAWDRPRIARYTDAEQQRIHAGDRFFEYTAALAQQPIVWPGKEFFQQ